MEVVPTGDGDESDGVIWFRCPQCQGFLPKLGGADLQDEKPDQEAPPSPAGTSPAGEAQESSAQAAEPPADQTDADLPWDSPADMMAAMARKEGAPEDPADTAAPDPDEELIGVPVDPESVLAAEVDVDDLPPEVEALVDADEDSSEEKEPEEPIMEYAAMLAGLDPTQAVAYRPWGTYEQGQCIHHLAWDDCGVVVAKEDLPGGRKVIKVYFEEAGVVRLIEQAPR